MIHPLEFFTDEGDVLEGSRAPYEVNARFWIVDPELRETVHRPRLAPGLRLEILEGSHVVGRGVVTKLVSLARS